VRWDTRVDKAVDPELEANVGDTRGQHAEFTETPMRVLLVEDDRMIGAAVTQALKDAAYAVDWVMDGQTALEAAEAELYDLAVLDLGLPAPDGVEVLRRFRTIDVSSR
jgi:CheY-like chemotaxis protein